MAKPHGNNSRSNDMNGAPPFDYANTSSNAPQTLPNSTQLHGKFRSCVSGTTSTASAALHAAPRSDDAHESEREEECQACIACNRIGEQHAATGHAEEGPKGDSGKREEDVQKESAESGVLQMKRGLAAVLTGEATQAAAESGRAYIRAKSQTDDAGVFEPASTTDASGMKDGATGDPFSKSTCLLGEAGEEKNDDDDDDDGNDKLRTPKRPGTSKRVSFDASVVFRPETEHKSMQQMQRGMKDYVPGRHAPSSGDGFLDTSGHAQAYGKYHGLRWAGPRKRWVVHDYDEERKRADKDEAEMDDAKVDNGESIQGVTLSTRAERASRRSARRAAHVGVSIEASGDGVLVSKGGEQGAHSKIEEPQASNGPSSAISWKAAPP